MFTVCDDLIALYDPELEGNRASFDRSHFGTSGNRAAEMGRLDVVQLGVDPDRSLPWVEIFTQRSHCGLLR